MCAYYGRVEYDIMLSGSKLNVSAPFSKLHSGHGSNATSVLSLFCVSTCWGHGVPKLNIISGSAMRVFPEDIG